MTSSMLVKDVMKSPSPAVKQGTDLGEVVETLLKVWRVRFACRK